MNRFTNSFVILVILFGIGPAVTNADEPSYDEYKKLRKMAQEEQKKTRAKLNEMRAESVVTVKYVGKSNMSSFMGNQASESETYGAMVSPDGLVLIANSQLDGPLGGRVIRVGGQSYDSSTEIEEVKVILGSDEDTEYEAELIARDTDLDLAWIKITDTQGKTFSYVDFNSNSEVEEFESYYVIQRMAERFARKPRVSPISIDDKIETPKSMWIAGFTAGHVVFDKEGKTIGFTVTIPEDSDSADGGFSFSMGSFETFMLLPKDVLKSMKEAISEASKRE